MPELPCCCAQWHSLPWGHESTAQDTWENKPFASLPLLGQLSSAGKRNSRVRDWLDGHRKRGAVNGSVPSGGRWQVVSLKALSWDRCSSMSSLMTQTAGLSGPSAGLKMAPSKVVQLAQQKDRMTSRGTKLVKWAHKNLIKLNKSKCKVLHQGNPWHDCRLGEELIESSPDKKDLGIAVDGKLGITHWCALTAQSVLLGYFKAAWAEGWGKWLCLYSPLVTPHLNCCVQP